MDHERIRQEQDRSYTLPLVSLLLESPHESPGWDEAHETVRYLEDYRAIGPLRQFVEDRSRPLGARREFARTLASFDMTTTPVQRLEWWNTGDGALAEYALRTMGHAESSIVGAVASDELSPLREVAIGVLEWGFEEPEFQALKVDGLGSSRPEVRATAAYSISWDEPLAGEAPLRVALYDSAAEPARAAAYALQYFPSLETLDALRRVEGQINPEAEHQRAESVAFIVGCIEAQFGGSDTKARPYLQRWANAAGISEQNESEHDRTSVRSATRVPQVGINPAEDSAAFENLLDTTTGSFWNKAADLRKARWADVPLAMQRCLAERFVAHPDPEVRIIGTVPLARWNRIDELCALVRDEHAIVRKCAMYELGAVEPDPRVAQLAASLLPDAAGTPAAETLRTWVHHADRTSSAEVLEDLARGDHRFSIRSQAIALLASSGAVDGITRLMPLLADPPDVNWWVHLELLRGDSARSADRTSLRALIEVDNLDVAVAAARALTNLD